jgi:hypothetical protein
MANRRDLLLWSLGLGLTTTTARAAPATLSKDQVGYQDIPHNGAVCAQCVYFQYAPSVGGVLNSRCQMVAGPISPSGWCEIWATKL